MDVEAVLKSFPDSVRFEFETSKRDSDNFFESEEATSSSSFKEENGVDHRNGVLTSIPSVALQFERVSLFLKLWLRRIRFQKENENQENPVNEHLVEEAVHLAEDLKRRLRHPPRVLHRDEGGFQLLLPDLSPIKRLLPDIKEASFKMLKEGRDLLERETVRVCSCLGLQIDFLDRLQDMPEKLRHHRTLCDWIVIFLRNNFTALSDLSGKNSLSKKLLHGIGFDPLSSAVDVIVKRARSDAQHIDWCDWAEIFVQDEFKYNPFLNSNDNQLVRSEFPFQSAKINECFKPLFSERKMTEDSHAIARNLNEFIDVTEIPRGIEEQSEDLYHGTDHESAVDILNGRGIHLSAGRQKRDFSSGKGFYLTKKFDHAFKWAKRKTIKPAILVFRLKHGEFWNNEKIRRLNLCFHENPQKWAKIVALFRSGKQSAETREISRNYDLIEGSVAKVSNASGHLEYKAISYSNQMCLISRDLAKKFQKSLHSILFYRDNSVKEPYEAPT